jgi:hypothetical protein
VLLRAKVRVVVHPRELLAAERPQLSVGALEWNAAQPPARLKAMDCQDPRFVDLDLSKRSTL